MLRKSEKGNTVYFGIGVWFDEEKNCIEMRHAPEAKPDGVQLVTTVRADPSLRRGHPNLFMQLAKVPRDSGAPAPDAGG